MCMNHCSKLKSRLRVKDSVKDQAIECLLRLNLFDAYALYLDIIECNQAIVASMRVISENGLSLIARSRCLDVTVEPTKVLPTLYVIVYMSYHHLDCHIDRLSILLYIHQIQ